jgi:sugar lactone lactonase YvrE
LPCSAGVRTARHWGLTESSTSATTADSRCRRFPWVRTQVPTLQPEGDAYLGGSVQRVDLQTGAFETVCGNASRSPSGLRGPDDIVFDAHGGFWFTDWGKERATDRDITAAYYVAPGTSQPVVVNERALGRRSAPNGIAISPDGKWLYVAETYARWTRKWELDPQAGGKIIPNPKTFDGSYLHCGAYPCEGRLDSMKVDREGNLYVVTILTHGLDPVSKGGISVVSPEGELQEYLEIDCGVPDPLPSNLCFGGPDGLTMFVTMGGTGRVLKCRMRISGLAAPLPVAAKSAKATSA